jgi:hypothetical protein
VKKNSEILDRIYSRVRMDEETGCSLYQGGTNGRGYGRIYWDGKMHSVHRVVFELTHGIKIPKGLVIDHVCSVKNCCNPQHLSLTTQRRNILLSKEYVEARERRLKDLISSSLELQFFGVANFDTTTLKRLFKCRTDNGNHVIDVLVGMQSFYPGRFQCKKVRQGRGRRPSMFEIRIDTSLREEIMAEDESLQTEADVLTPSFPVAT